MKHSKIAIIGAGSVGTTTAYALMLKNVVAELLLIDIDTTRCYGEILDLSDVLPFCQSSKVHNGTINDARNADIIIIAAGARQQRGQSRIELLEINKKIIQSILSQIKPVNPNAIVIMVTNPVDILTGIAQDTLGLPRNQVFGSGTFLDMQRLHGLIAHKLNIAEQSVHAYILGEHGDSQVVIWSSAHIDGNSIDAFPELDQKTRIALAQQTRDRAYEIIDCKGATFFGIATCVAKLCEMIVFDQKQIVPVSTYIESEGICMSLPVVLGEKGIEKVVTMPLNELERKQFAASAQELRDIKNSLK